MAVAALVDLTYLLVRVNWRMSRGEWRLSRDERTVMRYEELIKRNPEDPSLCHRKGEALLRLGRIQEALTTFQRVLELDPGSTEWTAVADTLARLGHDERALSAYAEAIRCNPSNAAAHEGAGRMLLQLGRDEEALNALQTAIRLDPERASAGYHCGVVLVRLGRYLEALVMFEKVLQFAPDDQTWHAIADALIRLGRNEEALLAFHDALRLDPANAALYCGQGLTMLVLGRFDAAVTSFRKAIRLADTLEPWILLAALLWRTEPEKAQGMCRHALQADDQDLSGFRRGELRALGFLMLGEPDEAEATLRSVAGIRSPMDLFQRTVYDLLTRPLTSERGRATARCLA